MEVGEQPKRLDISLFEAIASNDIHGFLMILQQNPALGERDAEGNDPLLAAARAGRAVMVDSLIRAGADLYTTNVAGNTALHMAAMANEIYTLQALLARNMPIELKNHAHYTPLHMAAELGHLEAAQVLLEHGADALAFIENTPSINAIKLAWMNRHFDVSNMFILHGVPYAIGQCAHYGDMECLKRHLDKVPEDIENLVAEGPNYSPLMDAITGGQMEVVKYLVERGADTRFASFDGATVFGTACFSEQKEIVDYLIGLGHDINYTPPVRNGKSYLQERVELGSVDFVKFMLDRGARLDTVDNRGFSPLHAAVNARRGDMVTLLLSRGASPNAKDKEGRTPAELAKSIRRPDLEQLLIAQSAATSETTPSKPSAS
jgi:ankyrin repeat protein